MCVSKLKNTEINNFQNSYFEKFKLQAHERIYTWTKKQLSIEI